MNKDIIKAMQGKQESKARKWWRKNGYKVWRVVLFPVWACVKAKEKITEQLDNRQVWSEERANEILSYYIPRASHWHDEEKCLYFFDNGMGWSLALAKRYLKRKDRRFWQIHAGFFGGKIRDYLIEKFQLEGFTKEVSDIIDARDDWTEITFNLNKEGA